MCFKFTPPSPISCRVSSRSHTSRTTSPCPHQIPQAHVTVPLASWPARAHAASRAPLNARRLLVELEASLDQNAPLVPLALLLLASYTCSVGAAEEAPAEEVVLTLDAGDFSEVVGRHHFIVVKFYTPHGVAIASNLLRSTGRPPPS